MPALMLPVLEYDERSGSASKWGLQERKQYSSCLRVYSKLEVGRPGNKTRYIQLWKNEDWS